ncbi:MAG TPA: CDP-alcohol phosphatidyltransferase family protein [Polyangiaceae bacterium]|nr:CDP-alcohol phosphatidyltransferase family protein [Polyangiaceae bacterium]
MEEMVVGAFVVVIAGVLCAYAIRAIAVGRAVDARIARENGTILLGRFPIEALHWAARAAGFFLVRRKVSPDVLTLMSLAITVVSLPLAATGHHLMAGCVFLFGAAFDALDGIVARARGLACQAGEVLDAIVDRYADAAPLCGLAIYFRASTSALTAVLTALVGSMMVSYVRAKHEAVGVELPGWLMRRAERVIYLSGGLILGPLIGRVGIPEVTEPRVLLGFVWLIGILSHIAAARLTLQGRAILGTESRSKRRP